MTSKVPINVAVQNALSDLIEKRIVTQVDEVRDTITVDFQRLAEHGLLVMSDYQGEPKIVNIVDYQENRVDTPLFLSPILPKTIIRTYLLCAVKNNIVEYSMSVKRRNKKIKLTF